MPNALAHYAVHGVVSRAVFRDAAPRWILLGSILPDVPWIARRAVDTLVPGVDPIDLRVYAIAQSSLAGSLLLAGALGVLAARPGRVTALLGLNALLHLLLDMLQTKWANGVVLAAPWRWDLVNLGLFWPEQWPTWVLTLTGAAWASWAWFALRPAAAEPLVRPPTRRLALSAALLAAWVLVPFAWAGAVERADLHHVATLRAPRAGAPVGFDRAAYAGRDGAIVVESWTRRPLRVEGAPRAGPGAVSLEGELTGPDTLRVDRAHAHRGFPRDLASYAGLAVLAAFWIRRAVAARKLSGPGRRVG